VKPTTTPKQRSRLRLPSGGITRGCAWAFCGVVALFILFYVTLLFIPLPLPFVRDQARAVVMGALPPGAELELGDVALALEGGISPVLKFSPVVYTDAALGAKIKIEALEVGFSPLRALIGQPGATVTLVAPHIQMVQDLLGPRVSNFELVPDPKGGDATVKIMEGKETFPSVGISRAGLNVRGVIPSGQMSGIRSDNEWLIYNMESAEKNLSDIAEQASRGMLSHLVVRDGVIDMHDAVYGLYRQFKKVSLDLTPQSKDNKVAGDFSADLGGRKITGSFERVVGDDGKSRISANVINIDFASFLPFMDDPEATVAMRGAGAFSADLTFDTQSGKIEDGAFHVDMTGMDLRVEKEFFPIVTSIVEVDWAPQKAQFVMKDAEVRVGQSSAKLSGEFILGFDKKFGPTVAMSITGKDVMLQPDDMEAPDKGFDSIVFTGWSAPLYGALGIDQLLATKGDARVATKGRVNMLRQGLGIDLVVGGEGVSSDDLKRLWPYFISRESHDWFVKHVSAGKVLNSTMKFDFPVGTIGGDAEGKPVPKDSISIDMVGVGVTAALADKLAPVQVDGNTRLQIRDGAITIAADGAQVMTGGGPIDFANAALVLDNSDPKARVVEVSGDVTGGIPAIVALAKEQQPDVINNANLPLDLASLGGKLNVALVATIQLQEEGVAPKIDYALNGTLTDFGSSKPIQERIIDKGQLSFTASQAGYRVAGQAQIDGMPADVVIEGDPSTTPTMLLSSTLDAKDMKAMGFDASEFLDGKIKFVAKPMPDGTMQLAADLKDAALTIKDLGISKDAGVPGTLEAAVKQTGKVTELSQINLAFGDVALKGSLTFDADKGLQSAEVTQLKLSPGDKAQLSMAAIDGGYSVKVRGDQLDLKPMLKRFFGLGEGSTGGVSSTQFKQTILVDVELKQALGFYKTTAFNLDLNMSLKGSDLQKVNMQANLGGENSISVTTNPTPDGKVMSVAFKDAGTLLRLLGVYPRVEGGEGSLVMNTLKDQKIEVGEFLLHNFALIDEANVVQILGNHRDSKEMIAKQNKLSFRSGKVDFIRRKDRIEVTEGVLTGDTVGGTMRGFIYTDKRQYDLAGTYVPLFGLNNIFQKVPLLGPLLGGRDGEGLLGVTFAVRGGLDAPDFKINPASMLLPGAFRSLFEFRAKEQPRVE